MNIKKENIPVLVATNAYVGAFKKNHCIFSVYLEKDAFWKITHVNEGDMVIYTTEDTCNPVVLSGKEYYQFTIQHNNKLIAEMSPLDKAEKKYLKAIIRPFRDKVTGIVKVPTMNGEKFYISIRLGNAMFDDRVNLPYFSKNSMYIKMETGKMYQLDELGL